MSSPSTEGDRSMVATAKPVGDNRYRETYGRVFEDFNVGDVYEHRPGRSITESGPTWSASCAATVLIECASASFSVTGPRNWSS